VPQSTIDCVNGELKAISSAAHSRDGIGKKTCGEYIKLDDKRELLSVNTRQNMVLQLPFNILKQTNVSQT